MMGFIEPEQAEPVMAEEEPVMEQAPPSLAAEAPVFGEEVMVEEAAAEEPHAEVLLGETDRSQTTEGEAMLAVGHAAYARKDWPAAMAAFLASLYARRTRQP